MTTTTTAPDTYGDLHRAVAELAARCDYARSEDGAGFNSSDTWLGHALAATPTTLWDTDAAFAAYEMLRKYTNQMAGFGVEYAEIDKPDGWDEHQAARRAEFREAARQGIKNRRRREALAIKNYVVCSGENEPVILSFVYEARLVEEARAIVGREYKPEYDGHSKVNVYPFTSLPLVIAFADAHDIAVAPEVRALADMAAAAAGREQDAAGKKAAVTGQKPQVYVTEDGILTIKTKYAVPPLTAALKAYNNNRSTWHADSSTHRPKVHTDPQKLLDIATQFKLVVSDDARKMLVDEIARQAQNRINAKSLVGAPVDVPGFAHGMNLQPHQFAAVRFTAEHRRVINADVMGLGKTVESLASVAYTGTLPAVVVCRPSLTLNWEIEIRLFFPGWQVFIAEGMAGGTVPDGTDVVIIGTAALGSTLKPPAKLTTDEQWNARHGETSLETVDVARSAAAVAYLMAHPAYGTARKIANGFRSVIGGQGPAEMTIRKILDGDRTQVQRRIEADLVALARAADATDKVFPWVDAITAWNPKGLIIDEGQDTKNGAASRSAAALKVAQAVRKHPDATVQDLSGTPLVNRPKELEHQLKILGRVGEFGGGGAFAMRYCAGESNGYGTKFDGAHHTMELNRRLLSYGIMLRRGLEAVSLPEFTRQVVDVAPGELDPTVMVDYWAAEQDTVTFLVRRARELAAKLGTDPDAAAVKAEMAAEAAEHLVKINSLRQLIGKAKKPAAVAFVRKLVNAGEKVMIAAHHKDVTGSLAKEFGGLRIVGDQSTKAKEADKEAFQTLPVEQAPVMTVAITAGGVGHTLTAARFGLQVEMPWTPGDMAQMGARMHRIGQKRAVTYFVMLAPGTVDTSMWETVSGKEGVLAAVLDGLEEAPGADDSEKSMAAEVAWKLVLKGLANAAA